MTPLDKCLARGVQCWPGQAKYAQATDTARPSGGPSSYPGVAVHIPVRYLRRFHAVMTLAWLVLVVPSLIWWEDSILWVILLSVWANVASHFGAWQAARAEDAAG